MEPDSAADASAGRLRALAGASAAGDQPRDRVVELPVGELGPGRARRHLDADGEVLRRFEVRPPAGERVPDLPPNPFGVAGMPGPEQQQHVAAVDLLVEPGRPPLAGIELEEVLEAP